MIYSFKGIRPVIDPSAFIHPEATIIGDVVIGKDVYIGAGAVLRGDWGRISVADGCNIQDNCVVHVFPGKGTTFEENAHIGHGAIVHGAHVGKDVLVGMLAVILDEVVIGAGCIIGAGSVVKTAEQIPPRSLVVGNPARIVKEVSDEMLKWKTKGTELYQQLARDCHTDLQACEPLSAMPEDRPEPEELYGGLYEVWKVINQK
ncbi:MAG TPA: transferase hexapeptide repeat family protein [Phaeodactylibacter sp.]|nr:transferase hexapeptide repeat family protein [Phaeodactylibacter sp.]